MNQPLDRRLKTFSEIARLVDPFTRSVVGPVVLFVILATEIIRRS